METITEDYSADSEKLSEANAANITAEDIEPYIYHCSHYIKSLAACSEKITQKQLQQFLKDPDPAIRVTAVTNSKADCETLMIALDDPYWAVRAHAIRHPNVSHDHLKKAKSDVDHRVRNPEVSIAYTTLPFSNYNYFNITPTS